MSRTITVVGATGVQGGSVIDAILAHPQLSKTYNIRGITRDTTKPAAEALKAKGIELVTADLNDVVSLQKAVQGSYAVFSVTNFWETANVATEIQQGKNVADASVKEKVHHLIWSSLPHVTTLTEGKLTKVEHFDGKAEVEDYIRRIPQSKLPIASFFLPAFYMSNVKGMTFPAGPNGKVFAQPWDAAKTRVPLLDAKGDTGKFVAGMLAADSEIHGKRVLGISQWQTPQQIVETVTEVSGEKLSFMETTQEQAVQAMSGQMGEKIAIELAENMVLVRDYFYYGSDSEKETPKSHALATSELTSWASFVKAHW